MNDLQRHLVNSGKPKSPGQPIPPEATLLTMTQKAQLNKAGLGEVFEQLDVFENAIKLARKDIGSDKSRTELYKGHAIAQQSQEIAQRAVDTVQREYIKPLIDPICQLEAKLEKERELKGGVDATVLMGAAMTIHAEKFSVQQLIAMGDTDFIRSVLAMPNARYAVLKDDKDGAKRTLLENKLAEMQVGKELFAGHQKNKQQLEVLRGVHSTLVQSTEAFAKIAIESKARLSSV